MFDNIKVFKVKLVHKTRRIHQCVNCGLKFPKGAELTNTTFSYDGRLVSIYQCEKCEPIK